MRAVSWNIEGRLTRFAKDGRRGSPEQIVAMLEQLDGDIVVLPEASDGDNIEPHILQRLERIGYHTMRTAHYQDKGDRTYKAVVDPTMKLLSRVEVMRCEELRLGDIRTMLTADVIDPETGRPLRVFGIHIDDRGEKYRLRQIDELLPEVVASPYPVVMMGDFNAMHGSSLPARLLRNTVVAGAIEHIPLARVKDLLPRLSQMAIGETMRRIEAETDLQRTDSAMRPTTTPKMRGHEWLPSVRMAQIDHIFVSPEIQASDFRVAPDGGADHRAISATIQMPDAS